MNTTFKRILTLPGAAAALCLGAMLPLQAQQSAAPLPADTTAVEEFLDAVVVTASRTPRSLKDIPTITQVVPPQEIKLISPNSVADLLQMVLPGVQMGQHGAQDRVTVQGLSADYVLFLVDGERMTTDGNGSVDLERIDPANIQRIEIVRGAASALYGSNAIGGVINIITREARQPFEATLSSRFVNQYVQRYNGFVGFNRGRWRSVTTGGYGRQAQYVAFAGEENKNTLSKAFSSWNVGEKLTYALPDNRFTAQISGNYNSRLQDLDSRVKYLYSGYTAGAKVSYEPYQSHSLLFSYNLDGYDKQDYYFTAQTDKYAPIFNYLTHTVRAQYNYEPQEEGAPSFNAGYEAVHEGLKSNRFADMTRLYGASTQSLYLQYSQKLCDWCSVTAGLREDIHSGYGAHLTPHLSLRLGEGDWSVRLSYSEGFRSPTLKELYMDWDHNGMFFLKGSPDLRPETSRQFTIAPEWHHGGLYVALVAYYNRINNRITQRWEEGGTVVRYINGEMASNLWSVQPTVRYTAPFGLSLTLNYAYLHDRIYDLAKDGSKVNISTTRPHNITGVLSYKYRHKDYSVSADFSGRWLSGFTTAQYDDAQEDYTGTTRMPGYQLFKVGVTQQWRKYISLSLGCDNLFNFRPRVVSVDAPLSPGRSFFATLVLTY